MRIHRLEIQAFGPFAGRETIDFEQLGAQGIFLLNGSTGAGKTSVLDAIAYALYGSVPGARSVSAGQLRSHHAAEGVAPEVLCEFSAGGRRLEVRRSPEWMRPVKRGSGTTREQASTQLREKTPGGWEVKSTRNDEAAAEIQDLLGMNMAQFTKVVLLAQGDFAAFLRASAADRQALLQRLFGTDVYERVQDRLAEDARAARAAVAAGLARLENAEQLARSQSAQVLAANEQAPSEEGQTPVNELRGLELFAALRQNLAQAVERTGAHAGAARFNAASLEEAVTSAQAQRSRHLALAAALGEQARLAEEAEEESEWRQLLNRHHQAQVLAAVVDSAAKTATAGGLAQARAAAAAATFDANPLAAGHLGRSAATATTAELESLDREMTKLLATVDAALPEEARHRHKTAQLAENQAAQALVLKQQEEQGAAVAAAKNRLQDLHARQEQLRSGSHNVEQSAQGAEAAAQLVATIEEYLRHSTLVESLDQAERGARDLALTVKENWLHAMDQRLSQAAGELAAALVDGEPCQVCGSTIHPAPSPLAGKGADLVKAEKSAKKLFDAAEAASNTARSELADARNTLAVLAERGGAGELDQARVAVGLRAQEHAQAAAALAELEGLGEESAALQQRMDDSQGAVVEAVRQAASLAAGHSALAAEKQVLEEHLTVVRDGHATLAQRREALAQIQEPGAALLFALRHQATAMEAASDAAAALEQALNGSDFADAAQVSEALLNAAEAAALDRRLKDHATAVAVNTDRLAAAEVVAAQAEAAAGTPVPTEETVASLAADAAAARGEAETAALAAGMARNAAAQLADTEAAYCSLEDTVAPLREKAQSLAGLADAVRGGGENRYKMTLSSYVLAARLEQVAQAASLRLATMSDARYTLRHSDARKGNQKAGLGLVVVDEWTGLSRDTATLSGGESFMASLSLALGLSDVVQQESGGLDIETLFVDEGFGSLDEQSLEQVMDALEGLRDGGRMVGLVSHVAEMKQRIPLHLHVHKGRNGSTVEMTMAGVGV